MKYISSLLLCTSLTMLMAHADDIDPVMSKQIKPCTQQIDAKTCMLHALKNAQLLTKYYQFDYSKRLEIDRLFLSEVFYNHCVKGELFAELRAIIEDQNVSLYKNGDKIGAEVFKISRTIDPKIQIVFDLKLIYLRKRDLSSKSQVMLVLDQKNHWLTVGLEEIEDGIVQVAVLDSLYSCFSFKKANSIFRKLAWWFKGKNLEK